MPPPSLAEERPDLPAPLIALVAQMLEKNVAQRPERIEVVAELLRSILRHKPSSAPRRAAHR